MREIRTSGSVGAPGGQPPGATRCLILLDLPTTILRRLQPHFNRDSGLRERGRGAEHSASKRGPTLIFPPISCGFVEPERSQPLSGRESGFREECPLPSSGLLADQRVPFQERIQLPLPSLFHYR